MNTAIISLIIFAVCVVLYIWNKLPISVTALLGLTAMLLFDVVSFSDGFKNFGSTTIVLICGMMVVGKAAFNTGLAQLIGEKVIALARGNERMIIMLATALTAIISAFLSNIATLAMMISILTGICAGNKNVHFKNVIMPVGMASVLGGAATLIGSTTQLTAQGIVEEYLGAGNGFSFFTFAVPGFLIIGLLVVYVGVIGYPLGKKVWGNSESYDYIPDEDEKKPGKVNTKKMPVMAVIFIATMILYMLCDTLKTYIPNMNVGTVSLMAALACVMTGCISHKEALKSINWTVAIWFCASLGIASGLNSSGGGELLARSFINLFGTDIPAGMLYGILVVLVVVLTQFLSNSTVLAIVLPVVFSITQSMGYNTYAFAVGLTIAGAVAVATPLANTTIGMTMIADYKFSDYVKYCGPMTLIATAVLLILVPVLWPLV